MITPTEAATRDLLNRIAQEDQGAFEELWRAYERPLFYVAFNIVGSREVADEVMQEASLAIWNGAKHFKGDCKPFTWMWTIVRNKAMDALRSNLRTGPEDAGPDDSWFQPGPENDAIICEALRKLSPEHRLVIVLTYFLNLSQYHISQITHSPIGTVKSRLAAALHKLKEVWR
jgi:RNA polymerase sigma-70 factor (ECF subfamily)